MEHLDAINLRLSRERERLAAAKTDSERQIREIWVMQIEREISREQARLCPMVDEYPELTDDELLAEFKS